MVCNHQCCRYPHNSHPVIQRGTLPQQKKYIFPQSIGSFGQNTNLTKNERIHRAGKPYKCSDCSKYLNVKSTLIKYEKSYTGGKPYECTEYGKAFLGVGILVKYQTGEKPHKCYQILHWLRCPYQTQEDHTEEKQYECQIQLGDSQADLYQRKTHKCSAY